MYNKNNTTLSNNLNSSISYRLIAKYAQDITETELKLLKAAFISEDITIIQSNTLEFKTPITRKAVSTRMGKGIGLLVEYKVNIKKGVSLMTVTTDDKAALDKILFN